MPKTALLEIGVEDLPLSFVCEALGQLKEKGQELFASAYLDYERIDTFGSSQRLAFQVVDLFPHQRQHIDREMGPPQIMVFDEAGRLTPRGRAYLKAKGVKKEDLGIEKLEKRSYVYIKRKKMSQPTEKLLSSLFPQLIKSINFPKSMRWGREDFSFGRPIRSISALFGEKMIRFKIAGISSDRKTRGHRFLSPSYFSVPTAQEYFPLLKKNYVIVDPEERKKLILRQMRKITSSLRKNYPQARIYEDEDLLEELVCLVEYPTLFIGEFDQRFLSLPQPVLKACLRDYQKHFSVGDGKESLAYFVGVREGNEDHLEEVVEGNRRVLNARLTDAMFFLEEDKKTPLDKRVSELKEMIAQEKLGSYYDKTMRLVKLAGRIASHLGKSEKIKERVKEAAYLCKADLVTQMVKEFPSLHGIMGQEYALQSGKDLEVAQAILEHRMPRFSGDGLPRTEEGAILALTDKVDTLVGSFWAGFIPSGAGDPWGLRREAQGIVEIILDKEWGISLDYLTRESLKLYGEKTTGIDLKVKEFLRARIVGILKEREVKKEEIKAVLKAGFDDVVDVIKRGDALGSAATRPEFKEEVIAIVRLVNILKQAEEWGLRIPERVREGLLEEKEERNLYLHWKKIEKQLEKLLSEQNYLQAYQILSTLTRSIHDFFEGVLVMSEDKNLRLNRLSLLSKIGKTFLSIADFTELQVK
ncbi:MAG: glycine--tRNA ligase subunit beta [bacterium]